MKRIAGLLLAIFVTSCLFVPFASAIVPQTEKFYINDAANILSDETEQYIFENSVNLAEATKAQIVVVTVPNLEGMTPEEYGTKLFREYGIGDKEKNSGLLILLALEERKCRIEVGYGLEGVLPDGKTDLVGYRFKNSSRNFLKVNPFTGQIAPYSGDRFLHQI